MSKFTYFRPDFIEAKNNHFTHFQEGLFLHYNLSITKEDYDGLINNFVGLFRLSSNKPFGYVIYNDIQIWCFVSTGFNVPIACVSPKVDKDYRELIDVCFSRGSRFLAKKIYNEYEEEKLALTLKKFETKKEAVLYLQNNTLFARLHIQEYSGREITKFSIIKTIRDIIECHSKTIHLVLQKK